MPLSWPPTLPTAPLYGDTEGGEQNLIHQETVTGPGKLRSRYTTGPKEFQLSFILTDTQCTTFFTFYDTTLGGGADTISGLPHPRTGAAVTMRFKPGVVPQAIRVSFNKWRLVVTLQQVP